MKCPTCESCEYEQYCGATEIMRKCERHNKKVEITNEEWFCQLPTEEKAEFMGDIWGRGYLTSHFEGNFDFGKKQDKEYWEMWLKQPHKE